MLYLAGQILVFVLLAMIVGAALAWVFLAAPVRRQQAAQARAARAARARAARGESAGGGATSASTPGRSGGAPARDPGVDSDRGARHPDLVAADPVTETNAGFGQPLDDDTWPPLAPRVEQADLADLMARLGDQEERWAAEKASLTARLAAAEQQAIESEQRVAAAEYQVAIAQARIGEIEAALHAAPAVDAGTAGVAQPEDAPVTPDAAALADHGDVTTVADLARETVRLREQLEEAESRAARFSSRLAMVRTDAEAAQRQVATMSTRLDRHQAEWAAERIKLLARIAEAEETRPAASLPPVSVDEPEAIATVEPVQAESETDQVADEPKEVYAVHEAPAEQELTEQEPVEVEPVEVEPTEEEPASSSVELTWARESIEAEHLTSTGPGAFEAGPLVHVIPGSRDDDLELIGAALVGAAASAGVTGRPAVGTLAGGWNAGPESAGRFHLSGASWGGPAEPVLSTDNLKEIVGVGPVTESRLRVLGITTFRQLATMGDTDVDRLAKKLDGFGDRIVTDDWVGQARDLQARHHSGLA
ncbi:hypothetical protein BBK14_20030 [Parafrankia soli]|uniref:Uncharacterized protein n=1 Tax=Parafrankia soli TaxID=2599596 RepID=A0A1S1Q359_9ACTN|nr:hypothetical protein [Parafrankia soli]OHV27625.1 hypothetical protein BBK14_20030 [Parafrankia soli]